VTAVNREEYPVDNAFILEKILDLSLKMAETRLLLPLLVYAVDESLELFNAENGYLILITPEDTLDFRVKRHRGGHEVERPQISHSILNQVLADAQPIVTGDAIVDPNFSAFVSVTNLQLRSVMCVPLVARNTVIGALYLDNRLEDNVFTDNDLKFLQLFANQAAVSIENAILNDDLEMLIEARTQELQDVQKQVLEMTLERERIKVLSNFIQDASHQFHTPLSIINTNVYLLDRKTAGDYTSHLSNIAQQTQAILELVNSLVLMAKLDGGMEHETEIIDLRQLVHNVKQTASTQIAAKHQQVTVEIEPGSLILHANSEPLHRAVYELLRNAIQYSPESGKIEMKVYRRDEKMVIEVCDSGAGLTADEKQLIFQRFYRGDKAGTTRGLGLGLSIVQKIAQNHGGSVEISSHEGQGSCFLLILPVNLPDSQ
jgi:signal transduction histidine kinase